MKQLLVLGAIAAAATGAQAVELFNNGAAASGTPALSIIRVGGTTLGFGAQTASNNSVADDFTVGGAGWNVESLNFFAYQSFAGSAYTFTSVSWSVVSGDVSTGTVVASGTTAATNGGLAGYRVSSTTLNDTNRAIFQLNTDVPDFSLAPGSYWLRWSVAGTLASGPWQPPTAAGTVGNAAQSIANAAFAQVIDTGDGLGNELPFIINGSVVPEPSTYALLLAGGAAVVAASRRRRQA